MRKAVLFFLPLLVAWQTALTQAGHDTICHADFVFHLDSLNHNPYIYSFHDVSKGFPDEWQWNFGDGHQSADRNPVHQYANPGEYQVCLIITRHESGTVICSDSLCQTFVTPIYHHLGGHAFIGTMPMNNPEPQGDTGIACLYRLRGDLKIPADTNIFTYLGYYTFPYLLNGKYLLKIMLTPGSTHYNDFLPSYFPGVKGEDDASLIEMHDSAIYDANIQMVKSNTGIAESGIQGFSVGNPYPVPAVSLLYIPVQSDHDRTLTARIFDMTGRIFPGGEFRLLPGSNILAVPAESLPGGIYSIVLQESGGESSSTLKFVKIN
jgi:hypothetical protein